MVAAASSLRPRVVAASRSSAHPMIRNGAGPMRFFFTILLLCGVNVKYYALLAFIAFFYLLTTYAGNFYHRKPYDLFGLFTSAKTK